MNIPKAEFLARRKLGIGGSDVAAILGLSPWKTQVDLWMEKTGRSVGQEETLPMRFGSFAEEFVAAEYQKDTGRRLVRFNQQMKHPVAPLIGNVDRLVIPEGSKVAAHQGKIRTDRGWEGKTANVFAMQSGEWGESGTDEVPPYYLVQVQTYQELSLCPLWDLSVLFGNQECRHYTIERDKELGEFIAAKANEWWCEYILQDKAPEPVCEEDIKTLFPRSADKSIEATQDVADCVLESQRISAQISELEKTLKGDKKNNLVGIQEKIKLFMKDASILNWMGKPIATYKSNKDSLSIDWESVANHLGAGAEPEIVKMYTTTKPGARPFRVTLK